MSTRPPRFLIIGAGSRGTAYAKAITNHTPATVYAVAEPSPFKRARLGRLYIWGRQPNGKGENENDSETPGPGPGQSFTSWTDWVTYEVSRRKRAQAQAAETNSEARAGVEPVEDGVDGVFVCVQDEMHKEVVCTVARLGVHILCEKPLATSLADCIDMYRALRPLGKHEQKAVFAIGHVLRYSPHNVLLRRLLREDRVIGDVLHVTHTEPVGWWHFTHSYVRGNWRREDTSAGSLLTKSCHDIDLLLWMLAAPVRVGGGSTHMPARISSTGGLLNFRKAWKPAEAGDATNCIQCPLGDSGCIYSAKNIYLGPNLMGVETENVGWPVRIVLPDLEMLPDVPARREAMIAELAKDYDETTPEHEVKMRNWFGRCVFDADNDVCDHQTVTITWDDEEEMSSRTTSGATSTPARHLAKTATFQMVAQTHKICQRYSHYYGTLGEIYADSKTITVTSFRTGTQNSYTPTASDTGHGGGDTGLAVQFAGAVAAVISGERSAGEAMGEWLGCTLEEVLRSHGVVWAAEEARKGGMVVDWKKWWYMEVEEGL